MLYVFNKGSKRNITLFREDSNEESETILSEEYGNENCETIGIWIGLLKSDGYIRRRQRPRRPSVCHRSYYFSQGPSR